VSQAVYTALTADGRAQLTGGNVETTSGTSTSSSTRAASISLGGVAVESVVVTHDTSFDSNLAAVSTDVGHTIDGSLGGDFLHDFYVTIDYPASTVSLARFSDLGFAVDQAEQIGLALEPQGSNYAVAAVSSAVAAKGVSAGDIVASIDGVDLSGLAAAQALLLLYGAVGSTKTVTFGTAAQVENQSLGLVVEEFLPLPATP
jgi:membrane-associated protease RseP (regulator of RpoE activity)